MTKSKETPVYVGQKAFINKDGKILVLRDRTRLVESQTGLDLPGGRFRWGNKLSNELKREVKEETGLTIVIGKPFIIWTNVKTKRRGVKSKLVLIGYFCKYKSGEVKLSDEHDYYEWVDKKSYKKWKDGTEYFEVLEEYFKNSDS